MSIFRFMFYTVTAVCISIGGTFLFNLARHGDREGLAVAIGCGVLGVITAAMVEQREADRMGQLCDAFADATGATPRN